MRAIPEKPTPQQSVATCFIYTETMMKGNGNLDGISFQDIKTINNNGKNSFSGKKFKKGGWQGR